MLYFMAGHDPVPYNYLSLVGTMKICAGAVLPAVLHLQRPSMRTASGLAAVLGGVEGKCSSFTKG